MPRIEDIASFIRSSFRSIWALELLLHVRGRAANPVSQEQLVLDLRASEVIISSSVTDLVAAGLVLVEKDGRIRYAPASDEVSTIVGEIEALYRSRPDAVRRVIVMGTGNLAAFADAFRLRRD